MAAVRRTERYKLEYWELSPLSFFCIFYFLFCILYFVFCILYFVFCVLYFLYFHLSHPFPVAMVMLSMTLALVLGKDCKNPLLSRFAYVTISTCAQPCKTDPGFLLKLCKTWDFPPVPTFSKIYCPFQKSHQTPACFPAALARP